MSLALPCLLTPEARVLQTWMRRESDLVQALAQSYAEREVLEASIRAAAEVSQPCHMQLVVVIGRHGHDDHRRRGLALKAYRA